MINSISANTHSKLAFGAKYEQKISDEYLEKLDDFQTQQLYIAAREIKKRAGSFKSDADKIELSSYNKALYLSCYSQDDKNPEMQESVDCGDKYEVLWPILHGFNGFIMKDMVDNYKKEFNSEFYNNKEEGLNSREIKEKYTDKLKEFNTVV